MRVGKNVGFFFLNVFCILLLSLTVLAENKPTPVDENGRPINVVMGAPVTANQNAVTIQDVLNNESSDSSNGLTLQSSAKTLDDPCAFFYPPDERYQLWRLSNLDFMGIPFRGTATCVNATSAAEARRTSGSQQCPANHILINPANPQYFSRAQADNLRQMAQEFAAGRPAPDRDNNPYGFYFCARLEGGFKATRCNIDTIRSSSQWAESHPEYIRSLQVSWRPVSPGSSDGDCMCRTSNTENFALCTRPDASDTPPPADLCATIGHLRDGREGPTRGGTVDLSCRCNTLNRSHSAPPIFFPWADRDRANEICQQSAEAPTEPSDRLKTCVDTWRSRARACQEAAQTAQASCRQNADADAGSEGESEFHRNARASSGAQNECFNASLLSSGARNTIGNRQSACSDEQGLCNTACSHNISDFESECRSLISRENPHDERYYTQNESEIRSQLNSGTQLCSGEVRQNSGLLSAALTGLGNALTASVQCMCRLSAGGQTQCGSLPSADACATTPRPANCETYGAIASCAPGATYNAAACNCELNPASPGCKAGDSGRLSQMASTAIRVAAAQAVGVSNMVVTNDGGGRPDLSLAPEGGEVAVFSDGENSGSSLAEAGASVAGGAIAGGAGGSGDVATDAAEAAKGKIGGMFSKLKNMANKLMGGDKNSLNPELKGDGKFAARGIASNRRKIGSKNMDIWKMMNMCVQGESCKTNQGSYIVAP